MQPESFYLGDFNTEVGVNNEPFNPQMLGEGIPLSQILDQIPISFESPEPVYQEPVYQEPVMQAPMDQQPIFIDPNQIDPNLI